jgi:molybdopterin converting factor small subunit
VKVLFYGRLADAIGRDIEIDAGGGCPVAELRRRVAASHPDAADALGRSRAVIASAMVGDEHVIAPADQVEFLPPVSGG